MKAEDVKARLDGIGYMRGQLPLKKSGTSWLALCPFHDEKTPSFNVWEPEGNWKCFGCGKSGDVFSFVMEREGLTFPQAVNKLGEWAGLNPGQEGEPRKKPRKVWDRPPESEAYHDYTDSQGVLVGVACRRVKGFTKSKVVHYKKVEGGFIAGKIPNGLPPYRHLEVADADPSRRILVVEGEGTADALAALGFLAISWLGGAKDVGKTNWSSISGRKCLVLADEDDDGRAAALQLGTILATQECEVEVRIPQGDSHKDIADYPEAMASRKAVIAWIQAQPQAKVEKVEGVPLPTEENPDVNLWEENDFWRVLGFQGEQIAFYQKQKQQVLLINESNLFRTNHLFLLNPSPDWWTAVVGGDIHSVRAAAMAGGQILSVARSKGIYYPNKEVGLGAFLSKGEVWWHLGSILLNPRGVEIPLGEAPSGSICMAGPPLAARPAKSAKVSAVPELFGAIRGYRWLGDADHLAFMGWLISSLICGALPWRSHVWLLAAMGSGKSWIMEKVVFKLLDELLEGRWETGESTSAAFRKRVGSHGLPFAIDEGRRTTKQGAAKFEELLPVIRLSSGGQSGISISDGQGDAVKTTRPRFSIFIASNIGHQLEEQDASRITQIRLSPKPVPDWPTTQARILAALDDRGLVVGEVMRHSAKILKNIDQAHAYLTGEKGTPTRMADQLSTLIGASSWAASPGEPEKLIPNVATSLLTLTDDSPVAAAADFWTYLLSIRLRLDEHGERSLQHLLAQTKTSRSCKSRAQEFGLKVVGDRIGVNPSAPQLREALSRTIWSGSDPRSLLLDLPETYPLPRDGTKGGKWNLGQARCYPILVPLYLLGQDLAVPEQTGNFNESWDRYDEQQLNG